jgi:kinetochore protein Mis13/DSN1
VCSLKANVRFLARAIQDQLLKDFSSRSEFSDWFAREEAQEAQEALRPPPIVKPNPRNIEHDEKIIQLEERIKRYESLYASPGNYVADLLLG